MTSTGRSVLVLSHIYPSSAFPGTAPFVRDEVTELARRNTVAVVSPQRLWPLRREIARRVLAVPKFSTEGGTQVIRPWLPGIPLGGIAIEPRLWAVHLRPLMRRAFRQIDGELVHAHYAVPDGYAAARFASLERAPLVLTVWGSDVLQLGRIRRAHRVLARTLGAARAIIAVSEELAEGAESLGASADRLHVIVSGVPYLPQLARDHARARLGVSDDALCVLWVGRLHPVKQPEEMIRAFDELRAEIGREALLVMVGDGPLRKVVRDLVRQRRLDGMVRLVGQCSRETTWAWQCAADVLVNSSKSEGTPRAVLEALGAGTPTTGYPLRGVQAALSAVEGGRVAAEKTPASLSAAILEELATSRDRSRLALRARETFAIERTVRAIEDVYESVV